jgi:hypothetical protein
VVGKGAEVLKKRNSESRALKGQSFQVSIGIHLVSKSSAIQVQILIARVHQVVLQ